VIDLEHPRNFRGSGQCKPTVNIIFTRPLRRWLFPIESTLVSAALSGRYGQDRAYLGQYLTIPVVNNAVAGRSLHSYTDEGGESNRY
jgi:hypothetical protein